MIGNVDRNLRSHIAEGRRGTLVLVATSRRLSNPQCRRIEDRIEELGFRSAHYPYAQQAIADRLCRNSRWLKELLSISGLATALSKVPLQLRPGRDLPMFGRSEEIGWLRSTVGDKLLVGQPGIGKTYLCQQLVDEGLGLYAVTDDIDALVNSIRDQQPSTIILEDAHQRCDTIRKLRHYRAGIGGEFSLVADCWPGSKDTVCDAMGIHDRSCRELKTLPPPAIVEIVKAFGIKGPNWLHHILVQQSSGCPGRAAMLSHACMQSDSLDRIVDGSELASLVYPRCVALAGERALHMLAGFAIGGRNGVGIQEVADALGVSSLEVRATMEALAFGGLVQEREGGALAVVPEPLREVLVRDYFFNRPGRQNWRDYVGRVCYVGSMCNTLIGAHNRGASVSTRDLVELLQMANDLKAWEAFAWSSPTHARILIELRPEMVDTRAQPFLIHTPELAVPLILQRAIDDERPLHSHPDHGLRQIEEWIASALPGSGQAVARRKVLWKAIDKWLAMGNNVRVALRALRFAVTLKVELHEQSAGDRDTFTFRRGTLTPAELHDLGEIWPGILERLSSTEIVSWPAVFEAADEWVYPGPHLVRFTDEDLVYCRLTAKAILMAIVQLAKGKPGVLSDVHTRCKHLEVCIDVSIDQDFARLFPGDPFDDEHKWRERSQRQSDAARELASQWSRLDPHEVAPKLKWCIDEARTMNRVWPDYTSFIIQEIVQSVRNVIPLFDALIGVDLPALVLAQCLQEAKRRNEDGWRQRALYCLRSDAYAPAALLVLMDAAELSLDDDERLAVQARKNIAVVQQLCREHLIPETRLRELLIDNQKELAAAVAEGMWDGREGGMIAPALQQEWSHAVCQSKVSEHNLCDMFKVDRLLAMDWLRQHASAKSMECYTQSAAITAACEQLSRVQKQELLESVEIQSYAAHEIVRAAIGDDIELYREFLSNPSKVALHLAPLQRKPNERWAELALVALDAGMQESEVAAAGSVVTHLAFCAVPSKYDESANTWDTLRRHADSRIRAVAEIGRRDAEEEGELWRQRDSADEFRDVYG